MEGADMTTEEKWKPRYSGPGRSGICQCGHSWEDHHLGMVMNAEYIKQTGEIYLLQECEWFGSNEDGGKRPPQGSEEGWQDHCFDYRDTLEKD